MKHRDFTLEKYGDLLSALKKTQSRFLTVKEFVQSNSNPANSGTIILRHDVDLKPENSLQTAIIEHSMNIRGTYYFRIIPQTLHPDIILKIASLGHEIGYHYEDMDLVKASSLDAHIDLAYKSFCNNLAKLREIIAIDTICMHGSPMGKYDNKMIWSKYNYKELGLICEPYYDIDFSQFAYFTDTGRTWNGGSVSIRDRVNSKFSMNYKSTQQIIENIDTLPQNMMFTIHPQRWSDDILPWVSELVFQNARNVVKRILLSVRKDG